MLFKSYMDESGIQVRDPYCNIAGYVAPAKEWERFDHDWKFVLGEYMRDIPEPLRYFHALEFYGDDRKYRSWKRGKRESFANALFGAIRDRDLALFLSSVDTRVFFLLTEDERRWLTGGQHNGVKWKTQGAPSKPYFLPFQFCMIQSANFVRDGDKVSPIMSRQDQYKMKALELYKLMLNTNPAMQCRNKLADVMEFSDPKKTPALQAADLAVYWFGRFNSWRAKTGNRLSDRFPERGQLKKLFSNVMRLDDLKLFDFPGLMVALQGCNRYIRTSFPTLDQTLPSLPVPKRLEILAKLRKVNFRKFLDRWRPDAQGDRA
jgi:hypothetical protein